MQMLGFAGLCYAYAAFTGRQQAFMLKTKLNRALMVITVVALAALSSTVSANCAAMAARALPSTCPAEARMAGGGASMPIDCMLQMHGYDTYIPIPSASRITPPVTFIALAAATSILRPLPRVLLPSVDAHPPPADPVPLAIRYSVFLK